jgi:hypothetical protein
MWLKLISSPDCRQWSKFDIDADARKTDRIRLFHRHYIVNESDEPMDTAALAAESAKH